nr:collagen alpha-1(I) chain-like [Pan troglodytes]
MALRTATCWDGTAGPRRSARGGEARGPRAALGRRGRPEPEATPALAAAGGGPRLHARRQGGAAGGAGPRAHCRRRRCRYCWAGTVRPGPARAGRWSRSGRAQPAEPASAERVPPRPGPRARPHGPAGDPAPRFREGEGRGRWPRGSPRPQPPPAGPARPGSQLLLRRSHAPAGGRRGREGASAGAGAGRGPSRGRRLAACPPGRRRGEPGPRPPLPASQPTPPRRPLGKRVPGEPLRAGSESGAPGEGERPVGPRPVACAKRPGRAASVSG